MFVERSPVRRRVAAVACGGADLPSGAEIGSVLRMRTREGMAIARANGRLRGKAPKLSARRRVHVLGLAQAGEHTIAELAELFSVSRATIYREIARARHDPT
jgi:DNA invertase Pin-like site-specific DNA recombinase